MTDKVIPLGNVTKLDLQADQVFQQAIGEFDGVILIGYDKEGQFNFSSTYADGGEVLWLLRLAEKRLLQIGDPDHE